MDCTVTSEDFESIDSLHKKSEIPLKWDPLFVTPIWLETWWKAFGSDYDSYILAVRENEAVIGIAPLKRKGEEASFIGNSDVCDYLDFVIVPGKEQTFFNALLDYLKQQNITGLDLQSVRPDSTVMTFLTEIARARGYNVDMEKTDVSLDLELPETWDEFLQSLNTKQRHEVRRKIRRLEEAGEINYYSVGDPEEVRCMMELFLKMFTESREDKADFLTGQREYFFRSLGENLSEMGIYRFGILELKSIPVAMIIYFDFNNGTYLYNSGFEKEFTVLSVGLISKILAIKESIESGKQLFDFLKGDEVYKYRLGGREMAISDCRITLK